MSKMRTSEKRRGKSGKENFFCDLPSILKQNRRDAPQRAHGSCRFELEPCRPEYLRRRSLKMASRGTPRASSGNWSVPPTGFHVRDLTWQPYGTLSVGFAFAYPSRLPGSSRLRSNSSYSVSDFSPKL